MLRNYAVISAQYIPRARSKNFMFLNPTLCSLNSVDGSQLTVDPSVVYVGPGDNHNSHKELVHLHKHTRDTLHSLNNSLVRYSVYLGTCFTTQHWSDRVGFLSHCQYTLVQHALLCFGTGVKMAGCVYPGWLGWDEPGKAGREPEPA